MTTTINAASTGLVSTADSSTALAFQTAGTTAMTIDSSQRVGIGNTTPTTTLGVTGTAYVTGNITAGGNIAATYFVGNGSALTGVAGVPTTVVNGTTNFTLAASGNANLTIAGTSNVVQWSTTGGYVAGLWSVTGNITGSYILGNGSQLTGIDATSIQNGTSNVRVVSSGGNVTVGVGGTSNVAVFATTGEYVTGVISASGNITGANLILNGTAAAGSGVLIVSGNIQTSTANATANIGNASNYFNRLFAQATTALYADLAEMYTTDAEYKPGTVLIFGGNQEVTMSTVTHDTRVAGVVSTNPAHIMNSGLQAEHTVEVALVGRVPVSVIGNITAGDQIVTSNQAGVAEALDITRYQPGVIIGKALQSHTGNEVGVIEVVVGRL